MGAKIQVFEKSQELTFLFFGSKILIFEKKHKLNFLIFGAKIQKMGKIPPFEFLAKNSFFKKLIFFREILNVSFDFSQQEKGRQVNLRPNFRQKGQRPSRPPPNQRPHSRKESWIQHWQSASVRTDPQLGQFDRRVFVRAPFAHVDRHA